MVMKNKHIHILLSFLILFFTAPTFVEAKSDTSKDKSSSVKYSKKKFKNKKLEKKKGRIVYRKFLDSSSSHVGAPVAHSLSFTGKGSTVVIIDSGINSSHPMVRDKVILEACFTTTNSCPNKSNKQIGPGFAAPVHWHGTHVAAIAAGSPAQVTGIAPDAQIIAINVFDKDGSSSDSSIASALNWVANLKSSYNIAAVNMSLGTSRIYRSTCDNVSPAITTAIHKLYDKNIPVIAAAGNSSSIGMSNPACISKVVSVASTSLDNNINYFSNISSNTTFAAPGFQILSAAGNSYRRSSGTSMAAPHVTGIFALYRQAYPSHTLPIAITNLVNISDTATDLYSSIKIPSINISKITQSVDAPSPTTTIPSSPSSTLPPKVPTIPTIAPQPLFKPLLMKLNTPTSNSSFFYVTYQDSFAPKSLVSHYVLDCGISTYNLPFDSFKNTHVYKINSYPLFTSCFMYAIMKDGTLSAKSTLKFLDRG
jgi:subtilisin family serine protease